MQPNAHNLVLSAAMAVAVAANLATGAHPPDGMTYHGYLTHLGDPFTGSVSLEYKLWAVDHLGEYELLTSVHVPDVQVAQGLLTTEVDFDAMYFDGGERWLEVVVDGQPLSPMQPIFATPYAMHALNAPFFVNGNHVCYTQGHVGIGTDNPVVPLHVLMGSDASGTGGGGHIVVGDVTNKNLVFDTNEIMARNGDVPATLYVNHDGGDILFGVPGQGQTFLIGGALQLAGDLVRYDDDPLDFFVAGTRALRLAPGSAGSPNVIGGSSTSTVTGADGASIDGGEYNTIEDGGHYANISGGRYNTVSGEHSSILGGYNNTVSGNFSVAVGHDIEIRHDHCFIWRGSGDPGGDILDTGNHGQFIAQAFDGFWLYTTETQGVGARLPAGSGSWLSFSDRAGKDNLQDVDHRAILDRLSTMPVYTWNYTTQSPSVRHMGPTAQGFYGAFGLGEDEKYIGTIDADGVALAAIKGLHEVVVEQRQYIVELESRLTRLEAVVSGLVETQEREQ